MKCCLCGQTVCTQTPVVFQQHRWMKFLKPNYVKKQCRGDTKHSKGMWQSSGQ